jgi:exodeoxyribonuclease VII large subunit
LPLIVGIGHDIDESVLDIIANTSLKTPTAVADFLIERLTDFEAHLAANMHRLRTAQQHFFTQKTTTLQQTMRTLHRTAQAKIQAHEQRIWKIETALPHILRNTVSKYAADLAKAEQKIALLDPKLVLQRGFSMTQHNGKPILSANAVSSGDTVETITAKATFTSTVT